MACYRIKGKIKNRKYLSRKKFRSEKSAIRYAYSKSYNKSGNTKKKNGLHDFEIIKINKK